MLTSQRSATDEAAEKPNDRILNPKQQQLEETQKITQQLIIIKKLLETSLTPGVDGLTAAQRLLLKQSAETHNRIGEATAAVKENTEGQSKILAALDKNTVAVDKFRTYLENWDARTRIHDRAPATPTSPTPPQDPNKGPLRPADTTPSRTDVTWRTFKTRTPGGWIPVEESKELHDTLLAANGKSVVLQGFTYRLSGDANQYIQRFPVRRTQ